MRTELVTALKRQATDLLSDIERDGPAMRIRQHDLPGASLADVESCEHLLRIARLGVRARKAGNRPCD
ncbi:hypothetical protein [Luteimonas sp. RC10]|uniref:hypothetical protein n=1 Tax=Luteimonas sp. RC10 TaxID=2587035 RepID=UPI00162211D6|nr:hypothetical protein [Luteimonas sp. RC10]MBB3342716.1 hypothetical protein [Luteimonas sp. RC10]